MSNVGAIGMGNGRESFGRPSAGAQKFSSRCQSRQARDQLEEQSKGDYEENLDMVNRTRCYSGQN